MANRCIYTNMFRITNMEALHALAERIATADGTRDMSVRCYDHADGRVSFAGLGTDSGPDWKEHARVYDFTQAHRDLQQILAPGEVCAVTEAVLDRTSDWVSSHAHIVTRDQAGLIRYPFGEQPTVPPEEARWKLPVLRAQNAPPCSLGAGRRILSSPFRVIDRKALEALLAASAALRPHPSGLLGGGWAWRTYLVRDRDELEAEVAASCLSNESRGVHMTNETYSVKEILESPDLLQRAIGVPLLADIPAAVPTGDDGAVVLTGRGDAIAYWPAGGRHTSRCDIEHGMQEFAWRLSQLIAPESVCVLWQADFCWPRDTSGYILWDGRVRTVKRSGFGGVDPDELDLSETVLWLGKACAASGLLQGACSQEYAKTEWRRSRAIHDGFQTAALLATDQITLRTESDRAQALRSIDTLEKALTEAACIEDISMVSWTARTFRLSLRKLQDRRSLIEQLIDALLAAGREMTAPGRWQFQSSIFETSNPEALEDLLRRTRTMDGATLEQDAHGNGSVRIHGTGCLVGTVSDEPDSVPDRNRCFQELIPLIDRHSCCLLEETTEWGRKRGYIADPGLHSGTERTDGADTASCTAAPSSAYVPLQTDDMVWENVAVPCILPALYAAVSDDVLSVMERNGASWARSSAGPGSAANLERKQRAQYDAVQNVIRAMQAGRSLQEGQIAVIRAFLSRYGGIEPVQDADVIELIEGVSESAERTPGFHLTFDGRRAASWQMVGELTLKTTDAGITDKRSLAQWALQLLDLWERSTGYRNAAGRQETALPDTQPAQIRLRTTGA